MLLAIYFTLALAASGYAFADSEDKAPWTPSAACLGFVLAGLVISAGWWLGVTAVPGMLVFSLLTLGFGAHRFRRNIGTSTSYVVDVPNVILCLAVTALVGTVFYPLFRDGGTVNQLPGIFDLPKHISALAACARTAQFPVENPWVPQADFAYQTSYYAPFAAVAAALGTSPSVLRLSAAMPVVSTFLLLMVLSTAGRRLGLSRPALICAILLASVVGGYTSALVYPGPALGATLASTPRLGGLPWFEDPFTYYIYIPNHIFSLACIVAAWLEATRPTVRMAGIVRCGLLLAGSVQSSGAFVAHAAFAACVLAFFHWWDRAGHNSRTRLIESVSLLAAFGVTAAPFALAALGWAQGAEQIKFAFVFSFEGWMTQLLAIGPFAALFILGTVMATFRGGPWNSFLILLAPSVLFLYAIPHMEIAMKSAMFIRLLGVLAASLPIEWLFAQPRTKPQVVLLAGVALGFLHAAYFSSLMTTFLVRSAYVKWDPPLASLVTALQNVPFSGRIRISPPNQELAALSGHNTFMDFTPIRRSGYLPHAQMNLGRSTIEDLEQVGSGVCPDAIRPIQNSNAPFLVAAAAKRLLKSSAEPLEAMGYIFVPNPKDFQCNGVKVKEVALQPVDLGLEQWSPWPGSVPGVAFDMATMTLSSAKPVDVGLVRPLQLRAGRYRIRLQLSGKLTGPQSGAAHLSILGKRKLITIPPGEYTSQVFEMSFESATSVSETLAFGLGGWAAGAGTLRLESLTFSLSGVME